MIQELRERQKHLDRVIAVLEQLQNDRSARPDSTEQSSGRRGRKSMNDQERREVSERMRRYWSARKEQENSGKKPTLGPPSV
jgi:hypothetical protein